ncbi:unnamed protein product [Schistosoma turkestanicum]|nr:unnamed protein product [Schistosoma turkestanicum]
MPTEASNSNNNFIRVVSRASDAEVNNRVLRSTLNDLSYQLLSQTLTKNPNINLSRDNKSVQTTNEFCQSKSVEVEIPNQKDPQRHIWKFRQLKEETHQLLQLVNQMKSLYVQNYKIIQNHFNNLTDLISTTCNFCLKINQAYHDDDVNRKNERQSLFLQLENEKHLNKELCNKLNTMEEDKNKLENIIHKLKEQREHDMKEFNANKHIKRLKEELSISKLQAEQVKQDFEAYKIYAKELLDNEKNLNKELRKLYH